MDLSPQWVPHLQGEGLEAVHWSSVGSPRASDDTVMGWARGAGHVVFTHDLDYPALLAATNADGPSVLQLRDQDVLPEAVGERVVEVTRTHADALRRGAVVSVDSASARVRVVPIRRT